MKTTKENCILFYNSKFVQGGRTDYVGLEITNRKLRLVMDTGSGMTEVLNDAAVTDGEWHSVMVQVNPTYLEITVDGKLKTTAQVVAKTGNKYLDLSDVVRFVVYEFVFACFFPKSFLLNLTYCRYTLAAWN